MAAASSADVVAALRRAWLGEGGGGVVAGGRTGAAAGATGSAETSQMTAALRAVLEAVKARTPAMSPVHTITFKEGAVKMRETLAQIEAQKPSLKFADLLRRPGYRDAVTDFANKVAVILGTDAPAPAAASPSTPKAAGSTHSPQQPTQQPAKLAVVTAPGLAPPADLSLPECLNYVSQALGEALPAGVIMATAPLFKDGTRFCRLINAVFPNAIPAFNQEPVGQFKCVQNLQYFLQECKQRLGLSHDQLLDPVDVYELNDKGVVQIGNTLALVVARLHKVKPLATSLERAAEAVPATPSTPSRGAATVPLSFFLLPSTLSLVASPEKLQPSTKRMRDYRLHTALDDGANLYRCVDMNMRRVTTQRIDVAEVDDEKLKDVVEILSKHRHPFTMPVGAYWYENDAVYIEMPVYTHMTLREWLFKSPVSQGAVQQLFSQILLGLTYLHHHGITHGRLGMDSIVMSMDVEGREQLHPIICCLGFAALKRRRETASKTKAASALTVTAARDVYALGLLMYESLVGGRPEHDEHGALDVGKLPAVDSLKNKALVSALSAMLHRKPSQQPSAAVLTLHPYFAPLTYGGPATNTMRPLEGVVARTYELRRKLGQGVVLLEIDSDDLTPSLLEMVASLGRDDFLKEVYYIPTDYTSFADKTMASSSPLRLKSRVLASFWLRMVHDGHYFEAFNIDDMIQLLPSRQRRDPELYRAIGLVILKCLLDRTKVPSPIAVLAYKCLQWSRINLIGTDSPTPKKVAVSLSDAERAIVDTFTPQLAALAAGLTHIRLAETLPALDFFSLACGSEYIVTEMLRPCHEFYDFSFMSLTPLLLREYINALSPVELRMLLLWATSQVDLRYLAVAVGPERQGAGFQDAPLVLKWLHRPSEHKVPRRVGFGVIELPELEDAEEVARVMQVCLTAAGM